MSGPLSSSEAERQTYWCGRLAHVLELIVENDANYDLRYRMVLHALHLAQMAGLPSGVRIDPAEPAWPVAFVELPVGQVSWHLPQHEPAWDGHTTAEKFKRIDLFAEGQHHESRA